MNEKTIQISQEEGEWYRSLFNALPDPCLISDASARIIDANAAACRFTKYEKEELPALFLIDILFDLDRIGYSRIFQSIQQGGEWVSETEISGGDGVKFPATRRHRAVTIHGRCYLCTLLDPLSKTGERDSPL